MPEERDIYHLYAPQDLEAETEADRAIKDQHGEVIDETYATKTELATKQDELISGANIKTINGNSLLGAGDLVLPEYDTTYTFTASGNTSSQTLTVTLAGTDGYSSSISGILTTEYFPVVRNGNGLAIGPSTSSSGTSLAVGNNANAAGSYSVAIGNSTSAPANESIVMGCGSTSNVPKSVIFDGTGEIHRRTISFYDPNYVFFRFADVNSAYSSWSQYANGKSLQQILNEFASNVYVVDDSATILSATKITSLILTADRTFTFEAPLAGTMPEYRAIILNSTGVSVTITLTGITSVQTNDPAILVTQSTNSTFVLPGGMQVELSVYNGNAVVCNNESGIGFATQSDIEGLFNA